MAKIRVLGESPPPPRGDEEEQLRDLRDYITRLKDELEYLLTHLGADNMDSVMLESLKRIGWIADEANQTAGDVGTIREQITEINTALAGKQDALTFDDAPTSGSVNPVKSGGVYSALEGKQDALTFDDAPVSGSDHPVRSGGLWIILSKEIVVVNCGTISGSPGSDTGFVVWDTGISAQHVLMGYELGNPGALCSDLVVETNSGQLTVSGRVAGSTTLKLYLGLPGKTI